jgi:hypothetical protein
LRQRGLLISRLFFIAIVIAKPNWKTFYL